MDDISDNRTLSENPVELQEEVRSLRHQLQEFRKDLEQKENNLRLAGEFGKKLLDDNNDLGNKVDEITSEYVQKIEALEQEKHTLKNKIEQEIRVHTSHAYDLENVKEKIMREAEAEANRKEIVSEKRLSELRNEVESLQTEVEKQQLVEKQLQAKIERLEENLLAAKKCQKELETMNALESDLVEFQEAYYQAKTEKENLLAEMNDLKDINQQQMFDLESLKQFYEALREQLSEKSDQASSWFDCLQETRQELAEVDAELRVIKMEVAAGSFKKKGNSLFGELEDKRQEAERKFISLKVKYESIQKSNNLTKQQLHKLKCQVAALFHMSGSQADVSKIKTLEEALSQSQGEVQMLLSKLQKLEKLEAEFDKSSHLKQFHDAFSDFGVDKKDYVEFLQQELQDSKNNNINLKKEIQTKTLLQLGERDRLRETERNLYSSDSKAEKLESENVKLRLKVDALKLKLQTKQPATTNIQIQEATQEEMNGHVTNRRGGKHQSRTQKPARTFDESNKSNVDDRSKFTLRRDKMPSYFAKKAQEEAQSQIEEENVEGDSSTMNIDVPTSVDTMIVSKFDEVKIGENELSVLDPVFSTAQEGDGEHREYQSKKSRKHSRVRFNVDDENTEVKNVEDSNQEQTNKEHLHKTKTIADNTKSSSLKISGQDTHRNRKETVRVDAKKAKPNECAQQ